MDDLRVADRGRGMTRVDLRRPMHVVAAIAVVAAPLLIALAAIPTDMINDSGRLGHVFVRLVPMHVLLLTMLVGTILVGRRIGFTTAEKNPRSPILDYVLPLVGAVGVALLLFWPATRWHSHLYGGIGDNYNWRWQIWRFGQELRHWHVFPTRFDDVVAPYGVDLRLNDGYVGMYIGGIWNLFAGPTLAYNLTVVTAILLNFWSARRLSLRISSNRVVAFTVALAASTAPSFTLRYYGHLNLCFTFVVFLAAEQALDLIGGQKPRILRGVAVIVLAFLSSFYFFVLASLIWFGAALIRIARPSERDEFVRTLLRISAVGAISLTLVSPFVVARLHHDSRERAAGAPAATARTDEYMYYSVDPRFFYVPSYDSRIALPGVQELRTGSSPNTVENTPFPGYLFIVAIGLAVFFVPRWRWILATLWTFFSLLALGPTLIWGPLRSLTYWFPRALVDAPGNQAVSWLPYQDFAMIPGLTALRTPNRFAMALPVIGVIAAALLAREFAGILARRRNLYIVVSTVVVLLLPNIRNSSSWYKDAYSPKIAAALERIRADGTDRRVVVAGDNCLLTTGSVNTQIIHRHPMIGCQTFSAAMPWWSELDAYKSNVGLASIQCDSRGFGQVPTRFTSTIHPTADSLTELKSGLDVGWVIVDKTHICGADAARQKEIVDALTANGTILGEDDSYIVYAIN